MYRLLFFCIITCHFISAQLDFAVYTDSKVVFGNKTAEFTVKVTNKTISPAKAKICYLIPHEFEYLSCNVPHARFYKYSQTSVFERFLIKVIPQNFVIWEVYLAGKKTQKLNIKVRAIKRTPKATNIFCLVCGSIKEKRFVNLIVRGGGCEIHLTTYDSPEICEVGEDITYVITGRNTGTCALTGIRLWSYLPKETTFVEVIDKPNVAFKYDKKQHLIRFAPIAILQPGDEITYKIKCRAFSKGFVKNRTRIMHDHDILGYTNEEITTIYE